MRYGRVDDGEGRVVLQLEVLLLVTLSADCGDYATTLLTATGGGCY